MWIFLVFGGLVKFIILSKLQLNEIYVLNEKFFLNEKLRTTVQWVLLMNFQFDEMIYFIVYTEYKG